MKLASAEETVPEYLWTKHTSNNRFAKCRNRHNAAGDNPLSNSSQPAGPLLRIPAGTLSVRLGATTADTSNAGR